MKLVTRRRTRFERNSQTKKVKFMGCKCDDQDCDRDMWIQNVDKDDQTMILDFLVAQVSKPLLAVKRIVERGNR
eukprot:12284907-Karenia_brevis.AAC.1